LQIQLQATMVIPTPSWQELEGWLLLEPLLTLQQEIRKLLHRQGRFVLDLFDRKELR
jgi:hypothetical protein